MLPPYLLILLSSLPLIDIGDRERKDIQMRNKRIGKTEIGNLMAFFFQQKYGLKKHFFAIWDTASLDDNFRLKIMNGDNNSWQ